MDNLRTNLVRTSQTLAITGVGWWRWRPPLLLILLRIFLTQPFLPPNDRLRRADFLYLPSCVRVVVFYCGQSHI